MSDEYIENNQYNIGHICTKRQCALGRADKTAMRWIDAHGARVDYSFSDLDRESNRFANVLSDLGVQSGDIFFTYLPKMPEQFFAFLGALKVQAICGTMFSNFGEDALLDRLGDSGAKGVITKKSLLRKISSIRSRLPALKFIIVADGDTVASEGVLGLKDLMNAASAEFETPLTSAETPSVLHYTSGSTGKPKGVLHRHGSIINQNMTTREVLGLTLDDVFWCTADQGWVTGTSYGIIGPWSLGVTQVHYGGGYDAREWMNLLARERISVWYSAPTALRMLMREDEAIFSEADLSHLRHVFSVGEPLNPEVIHWARRLLKRDIYDTWFQTETGAIMISNRPGLDVRPGSMGKQVAGIEPAIIAECGAHLSDGEQGNLCLKSGWPSLFITYLNNDAVYRQKFQHGYYHTGDTARRDADGYYWFMGRSDDVINTAGHLVSPFEVESALLEVEEVAESGVVGVPDELLYEKVVAFISLHERYTPSSELEIKIRLRVSNKVSTVATPQEIIFCPVIPKNKSGKIMRRVLKARYMGEDPGDTSTMEI
ncbi:MAG: AMP-binding protein [Geobacteraceae bacterium]|nr:AMP-binding protein [Geobacteraceae bacterium]